MKTRAPAAALWRELAAREGPHDGHHPGKAQEPHDEHRPEHPVGLLVVRLDADDVQQGM